jgi:hypothetical protein
MNTMRFGAALVALLTLLATPTLTLAQTAVATGASSSTVPLVSVRKLSDDIYEFNYLLTTSVGRYHQVGVHRVVRVEDGKPIVSHNAVFLAHGDASDFNTDFMSGTHSPMSLPVYLARMGIDVWGIDYGWALVPLAETDFTFMKTWGLQRDIDDLEKALAFARAVRSITGSGGGRFTLLGDSLSGWTGYALLNQESQKSCAVRQVKAWIPVETIFNTNDPIGIAGACEGEAALQQAVAQGIYNDSTGSADAIGGTLSLTDPNGTSPFFPPDTNLQAFLVVGAATWQVVPIFPPLGHYYAGTFGPSGINGIPTRFTFTSLLRAENTYIYSPSYEPIQLELESNAIQCGDGLPAYSSNLSKINVPVFYVGAAGGDGRYGLYTLTLLGSGDISHHIVSFYPPSQVALDYGHADIFDATNAKDVAWSKILAWLRDHEEDNSCPAN